MPPWMTSLLRLEVSWPWRGFRSRTTSSGCEGARRAATARPTTPAPMTTTPVSARLSLVALAAAALRLGARRGTDLGGAGRACPGRDAGRRVDAPLDPAGAEAVGGQQRVHRLARLAVAV